MHDIKNKINKAINDNKDEIIAFVQELVRTPSLANQESNVQHIRLLISKARGSD